MITNTNFPQIASYEYITNLTPAEFEYFTKHLLEHLGYSNVHVTRKHGANQADAGIDCIGYKDNQKVLVQAKKWNKGYKDLLPLHVIRELGGCMLRDKVTHGVITTTLNIDSLGKAEADAMGILLVGKERIIEVMKSINPKFTLAAKQKHWFIRLIEFILSIIKD